MGQPNRTCVPEGYPVNEEEARLNVALAGISAENVRLRNAQSNVSAQFAALQQLLSEMTDTTLAVPRAFWVLPNAAWMNRVPP